VSVNPYRSFVIPSEAARLFLACGVCTPGCAVEEIHTTNI